MNTRKFQWLKGDKTGKSEIYATTVQENGIDYIVFKSGARVTTDLIGDFITEVSEDGQPFINSQLFEPVKIINTGTTSSKKESKNKTKSDTYSLSDLIRDQLSKNNEFIKITIDVPVLNKSLYNTLTDTYPEVLGDLTKIVVSQYINKDSIEKTIKEKMESYYINKKKFEKTEIINVKTEKF